MADVIDDLEAEQETLAAVLSGLSAADWHRASAASGWTVADVVLHLAQTEEAVAASADGDARAIDWRRFGSTVDSAMGAMVRAQAGPGPEIFARWQAARQESVRALRAADPRRPLRWVSASLKPRTLATTRLAEHWAHALDIAGPLRIDYPDTGRLRHVAWLGFSTLPYAFHLAGRPAVPIFCDLRGPDGARWVYGDPAAESSIAGAAGAFCRVGAQRLAPGASGLQTRGPHGAEALRLLRNYAVV
ncbi:maleylpyruvate isomerase family mycothiol-dependent enzyme [Actinoplanes oblitus]|uniref:Maleylpyruvate isomerase family mycothiol-dependent enzyme n=1 Tax=Actinoplanes oblitus TaxID=3040509 RepID=A0ABY8WCB7_9ACTN|nr:maleylpyruvate isomerase family mycothiol-dependent enzyme [Actinoplanes oblitus]WIM93345.1 maleylpyruvate isomerase family mycothiol-dependent enzyme [Actinoplanes oblitus]